MSQTQERWREQYRNSREFEDTRIEDLTQHLSDLLMNLLRFDEAGQSYLDLEGETKWVRRVAQIEEELALCGLSARASDVRAAVLGKPYPNILQAREVWRSAELPQGPYIARFGKSSYMVPTMQTGEIQISPASVYEASENAAVQDTELQMAISLRKGTKIGYREGNESKWTEIGNISGRIH